MNKNHIKSDVYDGMVFLRTDDTNGIQKGQYFYYLSDLSKRNSNLNIDTITLRGEFMEVHCDFIKGGETAWKKLLNSNSVSPLDLPGVYYGTDAKLQSH